MLFRDKKPFVFAAALINLLVWASLFSLYLMHDRSSGGINSGIILTFFYIISSIVLLELLIFYILRYPLELLGTGPFPAYMVSNILVTFLFMFNDVTVRIFGKQIGLEGINEAVHGWSGGELGDFSSAMGWVFLSFIIYGILIYISYRFFAMLLSERGFTPVWAVSTVVFLAVITIIFHFRLVAIAGSDPEMKTIKNKIPWQSITGFPEDKVVINRGVKRDGRPFEPVLPAPASLTEKTEAEQIRRLNEASGAMISRTVSVRNPLNILFINIEGLRNDMLNSENMPFLSKFASEKGFRLRKHYTTGNNTPGALFGMLTGLAPYYFEQLRNNGCRNIPLEMLKRAGYRQSIYYNSPKDYEHIYRDVIEKTEGRFVNIPGVKENYAPREKQLIERYLSDLGQDSRGKRFDYYLMNVTHFNYYYPPEFARYKPEYTINFTIISGTQDKFRKDRVGLMNRYKNSVCYADSLLETLIKGLERMGRLSSTVIVISGDHGEEFWEFGSFGHTWGLNNIQIQPAALIYFPGIRRDSIRYRYTSHQDFLPTVFDLIGLNADWSEFTTGKSLVNYRPELDYAVSSLGILVSFRRNGYAIIGDGYKILYKNNMELAKAPYALYDDEDREIDTYDPARVTGLLMKTVSAKRLAPPKLQ